MSKEEAYKHGFDCGLNGANTTNCNFKIFATPENTNAWERGNWYGAIKKLEPLLDPDKELNDEATFNIWLIENYTESDFEGFWIDRDVWKDKSKPYYRLEDLKTKFENINQ